MKASKKPRKQRTVKNGIVEVDDVVIAPGIGCTNWIEPVRLKLTERETKLMTTRLGICSTIFLQSVAGFTEANKRYFIDLKHQTTIQVDRMDRVNHEMAEQYLNSAALDRVKNECAESLKKTLSEWTGVKRANGKEEKDISFRKYFGFCKNWFDQIKLDYMAFDFWVPIFDMVDHFAQQSAAKFFCDRFYDLQKMYSRYLYLLTLEKLIRGTLKLPNSRERLLIPAGVYVKLRKNLSVLKVPTQQIESLKSRTGRSRTGSKQIREIILNTVCSTKDAAKSQFHGSLLALHDEFDHYGTGQPVSVAAVPQNGTNIGNGVQYHGSLPPFPFIPVPQIATTAPFSDNDSNGVCGSCCSGTSFCSTSESLFGQNIPIFSDRESEDSRFPVPFPSLGPLPLFGTASTTPMTPAATAPPCNIPVPVNKPVITGYDSSTFKSSPSQTVRYGPY